MTVPRWTVADGGNLVLDASSNQPLTFTYDHRSEISPTEWKALVAAVRDAETLTQARQLAATIRELHAGGLRVHQVADYMRVKTALLDLLTGDGRDPA